MHVNWRSVLEKIQPHMARLPVTLHAAQMLIMGGHRTEAAAAMQELIEISPNDLQAHQQLAALLKRIGRPHEAEQVLQKAALIEARKYANQSEDLDEIASFIQSSTSNSIVTDSAPASYVASLFDQSAEIFEPLLRDSLQYKAPELLLAACQKVNSLHLEKIDILDLGCGTGLAGEVFRPYAARLDGIDLSTKMLDIARAKSIYDELHAADIAPYLNQMNRQYPLLLAADVFVYIGDLNAVFAAANKGLSPNGHFAFTVEASPDADFFLQGVRRYAHSRAYLERLAIEHSFEIKCFEETSTRIESTKPVPSYLLVLQST